MTPFTRIPRDAVTGMVEREVLLAQPPEFFHPFFEGRNPSIEERLQFIESSVLRMTSLNIFENDLYHVEVAYPYPFIHVNIRRHDREPCKEWKHFQQIKNELVGPEYEAVELFPAESRLVDSANEYHLWVLADQGNRFPFGFPKRFVVDQPVAAPVFNRASLNCTDSLANH
jgi:hypothetical protein